MPQFSNRRPKKVKRSKKKEEDKDKRKKHQDSCSSNPEDWTPSQGPHPSD